ncbi:MAG: hypothetical protein MJ009_07725 [Paludibacteraceae bacterium]|nr:hypothetical protein [Paludibacteraceae bacterium]
MRAGIPIAITLMLLVASCHRSVILDIDREPVMELYGNVLYFDEIETNMPSGLSSPDSVNFVESYKKKWALDKLVYNTALNNVGSSTEIDQLVERYRKELIISEYIDKITTQNIEPVSEDSLYAFYQQQKENFPLSEPVAKGIFIKVATNVPDQAKLSKWISNISDANLENIMRYCTKHASYQQLFLDNWIPFSKVSELMAQPVESTDPVLSRGAVIQQTAEFTYYLKITGLCLAGTPQPFELVESDLNNILTNKAKIDYIKDFYDQLYDKAIRRGTITLYENQN